MLANNFSMVNISQDVVDTQSSIIQAPQMPRASSSAHYHGGMKGKNNKIVIKEVVFGGKDNTPYS